MRLVDKVIYFIFSAIVFAILGIVFMGILNIGIVLPIFKFVGDIPRFSFTQEQMTYIVIVGIMLCFMAIKGMFFQARLEENKDAIILENSSGKLVISRRTLENLVKDISNNTKGVENTTARVTVGKDMKLVISIDIVVKEGSIKDITRKLQEEVKTAIKKASDLNVSQVNVNIKNIKKISDNIDLNSINNNLNNDVKNNEKNNQKNEIVENKKEGNDE